MTFKITYSSMQNADMSALHKEFDTALARVRGKLGEVIPWHHGYKPAPVKKTFANINPANTKEVLTQMSVTDGDELDAIIARAKAAQPAWEALGWQKRIAIMRKAADLISERRMDLSVKMALEVGKNRMESLGDVEEAADLLRYYSQMLEEGQGFDRPLGKLSPNENTRSILRPYGVFAVVAPFNFPLALAAGMGGAALLAGNTVVLKPSVDAPWCAHGLFEVFRDAGLPEGVFQVVYDDGIALSQKLTAHKGIDGIAFTGSSSVGLQILRNAISHHVKPCLMEMGGKNAAIVCESADVQKAIEGSWRSAFGLSGQKCSALSRLYVHEKHFDAVLAGLVEKAKAIRIGDPLEQNIYMGPVINARSVTRYEQAVSELKRDGKVHAGGFLPDGPGYFVAPTVATAPRTHRLWRDELFLPVVMVEPIKSLDEALALANDCDYGLTGGVFSENPSEVDEYMRRAEAGVLYANRASGATTGAWPGVQAFCGWKGSGSTGKGGCGPYYVTQFAREQSQTRMG